jgi:hypothetical protein
VISIDKIDPTPGAEMICKPRKKYFGFSVQVCRSFYAQQNSQDLERRCDPSCPIPRARASTQPLTGTGIVIRDPEIVDPAQRRIEKREFQPTPGN